MRSIQLLVAVFNTRCRQTADADATQRRRAAGLTIGIRSRGCFMFERRRHARLELQNWLTYGL